MKKIVPYLAVMAQRLRDPVKVSIALEGAQ
jgi:hypothetical protein